MPRMDVTEMSFAKLYPLLVAKAVKRAAHGKKWIRSLAGSLAIQAKTLHSWSSPASPNGVQFAELDLAT